MTIWRLRRDGRLPKPKKLGNRNVAPEDEADKAIAELVGLWPTLPRHNRGTSVAAWKVTPDLKSVLRCNLSAVRPQRRAPRRLACCDPRPVATRRLWNLQATTTFAERDIGDAELLGQILGRALPHHREQPLPFFF